MKTREAIYGDGTYLANNSDWHRQDAPWKASQVLKLLNDFGISPQSIVEIGCGSGDALVRVLSHLPHTKMIGVDISQQAAEFWKEHQHTIGSGQIEFLLGDFDPENLPRSDVLLMLDVFEHVRDPFTFLESYRGVAKYFVFDILLDLSAIAVARGEPLLESRRKVGHLHFYTKDLALGLLKECGFEPINWRYTGASLTAPMRHWKTRLASFLGRMAYAVDIDFGVRLLGGATLLVLARSAG